MLIGGVPFDRASGIDRRAVRTASLAAWVGRDDPNPRGRELHEYGYGPFSDLVLSNLPRTVLAGMQSGMMLDEFATSARPTVPSLTGGARMVTDTSTAPIASREDSPRIAASMVLSSSPSWQELACLYTRT